MVIPITPNHPNHHHYRHQTATIPAQREGTNPLATAMQCKSKKPPAKPPFSIGQKPFAKNANIQTVRLAFHKSCNIIIYFYSGCFLILDKLARAQTILGRKGRWFWQILCKCCLSWEWWWLCQMLPAKQIVVGKPVTSRFNQPSLNFSCPSTWSKMIRMITTFQPTIERKKHLAHLLWWWWSRLVIITILPIIIVYLTADFYKENLKIIFSLCIISTL